MSRRVKQHRRRELEGLRRRSIALVQILKCCCREADSIFVSITDQGTTPTTLESFISWLCNLKHLGSLIFKRSDL